jgi:hypothetical protein
MGIETALIGTAVAGGLGGAISGGKGEPEQVQKQSENSSTAQNSSGTQRTTFDPVSGQQKQLQDMSLENYFKQQGLADQGDASIQRLQGSQDQSLRTAGGLMDGSAMALTPEEQQRIGGIRDSLVTQGGNDIQQFMDKNLGNIQQSAGVRGLRGQAVTSLQGQAMDTGAQQMRGVVDNANNQAAQLALQMPGQRAALQSSTAQQFYSLPDVLRQSAQSNRQLLQNPALLQLLQGERLAGGTTTNNASNSQTSNSSTVGVTPGKPGGFMAGLGGMLSGAAGGLNIGGNIATGLGNYKTGAAKLRDAGSSAAAGGNGMSPFNMPSPTSAVDSVKGLFG